MVRPARRVRRARAPAAAGAFYYFYEMPTAGGARRRSRPSWTAIRGRIDKGAGDGAPAAGVPQAGRPISRRGSRACKPILPEEKDVGDLLRRIQTLAMQSNLTIRGFRPQPIATKRDARRVADRPRARGHVSQPRAVPRSRQQVPAHHQRRQLAIISAKDAPTPDATHAMSPARRRRSCSWISRPRSRRAERKKARRPRSAGEENRMTRLLSSSSPACSLARRTSRAQTPAPSRGRRRRRPRPRRRHRRRRRRRRTSAYAPRAGAIRS